MDFKITPGTPDGICIEVMFYANDWGEVRQIMEAADSIEVT